MNRGGPSLLTSVIYLIIQIIRCTLPHNSGGKWVRLIVQMYLTCLAGGGQGGSGAFFFFSYFPLKPSESYGPMCLIV